MGASRPGVSSFTQPGLISGLSEPSILAVAALSGGVKRRIRYQRPARTAPGQAGNVTRRQRCREAGSIPWEAPRPRANRVARSHPDPALAYAARPGIAQLKVLQDPLNNERIVNQGDHAHPVAALWARRLYETWSANTPITRQSPSRKSDKSVRPNPKATSHCTRSLLYDVADNHT